MRQHFQDYNFLFDLTVAKFRHNLFKGNFLTNTAISSFSLISHSLMNEFTWVLFWQKHWPERTGKYLSHGVMCAGLMLWIQRNRLYVCLFIGLLFFLRSLPEPSLQEGQSVWGGWEQHPHVCVPGSLHLPRRWGRVRACEFVNNQTNISLNVCWNCRFKLRSRQQRISRYRQISVKNLVRKKKRTQTKEEEIRFWDK